MDPRKTIKFEIREAIKMVKTQELKKEILVVQHTDKPENIYFFAFGLEALEQRLTKEEYLEFENTVAKNYNTQKR